MTATPSTMLPLGTLLPAFDLPDFDGRPVSSADFHASPALLVAFLCPHCPFVRHVRQGFASFAAEYTARGEGALFDELAPFASFRMVILCPCRGPFFCPAQAPPSPPQQPHSRSLAH